MAKTNPQLIMIAGPNGSGKSTLIDALRAAPLDLPALYINADVLQRERRLKDSFEAQQLAASMRDEAFASHGDLMYETVMSHPAKLAELQQAAAAGYHITVHFIATRHPDINVERVGVRVAAGGHDVPEDRIRERYTRTLALAPVAYAFAHQGSVFDNSPGGVSGGGLMEQATLVSGRMVPTVREPAPWVQHLIEQVNRRTDEGRAFIEGGRAYGLIPQAANIEDSRTSGPVVAVGEHFLLQYDEAGKAHVLHDRILLGNLAGPETSRQSLAIVYREGVASLAN